MMSLKHPDPTVSYTPDDEAVAQLGRPRTLPGAVPALSEDVFVFLNTVNQRIKNQYMRMKF